MQLLREEQNKMLLRVLLMVGCAGALSSCSLAPRPDHNLSVAEVSGDRGGREAPEDVAGLAEARRAEQDSTQPSLLRIDSERGAELAGLVADDEGNDEDDGFVEFGLSFNYTSEAEFDDGSGKFSSSTVGISAEVGPLEVEYERSVFSWSDAETLPFVNNDSSPIDTLHGLEVSLEAPPWLLNDELALQVGAGIGMGWEDETSESLSYEGELALMWKASSKLDVLIGLGYSYHPDFDRNDEIEPAFGIAWNQETEEGLSVSLGIPATELRYHFSGSSSLALTAVGGGADNARLADDSSIAPGGFVELSQLGVGLDWAYQTSSGLGLNVGVGYLIENEWTFYNSKSRRVYRDDAESVLQFSLELSYEF